MTRPEQGGGPISPPGSPQEWSGPLTELERWEWRRGDGGDPVALLADFLTEHGVGGHGVGGHGVGDGRGVASGAVQGRGRTAVALLAGADGCAALSGLPTGAATPVSAVPDVVAVAVRPTGREAAPPRAAVPVPLGHWRTTWTDVEHGRAVEQVRQAIARGELYQANVVGHRAARHRSDPAALAGTVTRLPGASYAGVLAGPGWAVGCASPEQLVQVHGRRITTVPVKGTRAVGPGSAEALLASGKDRAEHIMIVDLERNDLARVAVTGSVDVERLYDLSEWSGLWHAGSLVAAELRDDVTTVDVLAALLPGGSVTGAPKRAACSALAALEPVGRGPSMGAFGLLWPGGLDLGLTIRTVAADEDTVHLWAGGGVTWGSDPEEEVAEAHVKARPVLRVLAAPD